jgi:hypothetical protein
MSYFILSFELIRKVQINGCQSQDILSKMISKYPNLNSITLIISTFPFVESMSGLNLIRKFIWRPVDPKIENNSHQLNNLINLFEFSITQPLRQFGCSIYLSVLPEELQIRLVSVSSLKQKKLSYYLKARSVYIYRNQIINY